MRTYAPVETTDVAPASLAAAHTVGQAAANTGMLGTDVTAGQLGSWDAIALGLLVTSPGALPADLLELTLITDVWLTRLLETDRDLATRCTEALTGTPADPDSRHARDSLPIRLSRCPEAVRTFDPALHPRALTCDTPVRLRPDPDFTMPVPASRSLRWRRMLLGTDTQPHGPFAQLLRDGIRQLEANGMPVTPDLPPIVLAAAAYGYHPDRFNDIDTALAWIWAAPTGTPASHLVDITLSACQHHTVEDALRYCVTLFDTDPQAATMPSVDRFDAAHPGRPAQTDVPRTPRQPGILHRAEGDRVADRPDVGPARDAHADSNSPASLCDDPVVTTVEHGLGVHVSYAYLRTGRQLPATARPLHGAAQQRRTDGTAAMKDILARIQTGETLDAMHLAVTCAADDLHAAAPDAVAYLARHTADVTIDRQTLTVLLDELVELDDDTEMLHHAAARSGPLLTHVPASQRGQVSHAIRQIIQRPDMAVETLHAGVPRTAMFWTLATLTCSVRHPSG